MEFCEANFKMTVFLAHQSLVLCYMQKIKKAKLSCLVPWKFSVMEQLSSCGCGRSRWIRVCVCGFFVKYMFGLKIFRHSLDQLSDHCNSG